MVPPLINPNSPDLALIRGTVQKTIDASEAIDNRTNEPKPADTPSATAKPRPKVSQARTSQARSSQAGDLIKVCAA
jgi:hypothetical protein